MSTAAKLDAIRALVGASPDQALASLSMALQGCEPKLQPVAAIIDHEQSVRRLCKLVFAPLMPLFSPRPDGIAQVLLPRTLMNDVWRSLMERSPQAMAQLATVVERWDPRDPAPQEVDFMCQDAADLCVAGAPLEFRGRDGGAAARDLALYLRLCPFARIAAGRLGDWLGRSNEERAAVLRLIFNDATQICEDAAPRMMEILMGQLPDAVLILRPISLITERASDRYLASSELASFGERLLARAEAHAERLKGFDTGGGEEAAHAAGADASAGGAILDEMENSIEMNRDGPWGKRVAAARKSMANQIESRLRECQKAVEQALPMQSVRLTGRMTRPSPRVGQPPDPRYVEPAKALMLLLGETRSAATTGGFGALRTQVAEALSDFLEVYADELVHLLNAGEAPDPVIAHEYLELAADFLARAENDKAAQIVRRRAAVAGTGTSEPSQDVA